jgi:hypothetical protein
MVKRDSPVIAIALGAITVLVVGCAAFRAGNLPPVSPWPPSGSQKKSARLALTYEYTRNGSQVPGIGAGIMLNWVGEQTMATYVGSGLFSEVRRGGGPADITADVKVALAAEESIAMRFLTVLTAFLIPSKYTLTTTVRTTMRDAEGNTLATFEKSEAVNTWYQLFLVFWEPFYFPTLTRVIWGPLDDIHRATLAEAHAQGIV